MTIAYRVLKPQLLGYTPSPFFRSCTLSTVMENLALPFREVLLSDSPPAGSRGSFYLVTHYREGIIPSAVFSEGMRIF